MNRSELSDADTCPNPRRLRGQADLILDKAARSSDVDSDAGAGLSACQTREAPS